MERRGLNIRKGFLRSSCRSSERCRCRWHRGLSRGSAGSNTGFARSSGQRSTARSPRDDPCSMASGIFRRSVASSRATRSCGGPATCCSTASPTSAPLRCSRSTARAPRRGPRPGPGMHRAGQPLRRPPAAGALALPRGLPGAVLHGAAAARLAVPGAAVRDRRPARPGQAVHLAAGRPGGLGQLDPPRGEGPQRRDDPLPGRRRPLDRALTEAAEFLGRNLRFSTTWVGLAAMTGRRSSRSSAGWCPTAATTSSSAPPSTFPKTRPSKARPLCWVRHFLEILEDQVRRIPTTATTTSSGATRTVVA